jgi:hypothetical protein
MTLWDVHVSKYAQVAEQRAYRISRSRRRSSSRSLRTTSWGGRRDGSVSTAPAMDWAGSDVGGNDASLAFATVRVANPSWCGTQVPSGRPEK